MNTIIIKLHSLVWGNWLVISILSVGLLYTIKLKGIQFRWLRFLFSEHSSQLKDSSQLRTICVSLGTAMGTGNITGVAAALAAGGAGAVFWMWISAFFGMAVVYAENILSFRFSNGKYKGPMAYLSVGAECPFAAALFAVFCCLAALGMGGMVQVSSFTNSLYSCTHYNKYIIAVICFTVIYAVVSGGFSRIGTVAQLLLPAVTLIYMIISIMVLIKTRNRIPEAFSCIISEALGIKKISGGVMGYGVSKAVSVGIRRGLFSNEAGLGSSPLLHSSAESKEPELQGMWAMAEVFFDTVICCTMTAAVILCGSDDFSVITAFRQILGDFSAPLVTAKLGSFAFCTMIGWYFCGETALRFLCPRANFKTAAFVYSLISALGAVISVENVWLISDIFNGLMAVPNLMGLIILSNKVGNE